jgi:hypothetical protein
VGPARQDRGDPHGGPAFLQEDETGDVERHQLDQATGPTVPQRPEQVRIRRSPCEISH